jgi:carboxyl-terminal processing protease
MKKILLWFVFVAAMGVQAATSDLATQAVPPLKPLSEQPKAAHLAAELLTRHHYKPVPLDDALSAKIFDRYLKLLDGEKRFFVQSDIDHLEAARTSFDDAIYNEYLGLPFAIFNLYTQRVVERFTYARSLLKDGFDFRKNELYQYNREKAAWAKSRAGNQGIVAYTGSRATGCDSNWPEKTTRLSLTRSTSAMRIPFSE